MSTSTSTVMAARLDQELANIRLWEPHVQALLQFDEAAARQRAAAASGEGVLAGWSVGIKDIVDWAGHPTRCNAVFTPVTPAAKSAAFVDALLACGAFVMAKTTTTTFAYFDPAPTRNPWRLEHTPGGSSSGSAAAVAAGMVRLAIGTQTVASINRPASFCGVVGFKPSYGTFDLAGVFLFAPSVDTIGYFTIDAKDAQTAFAALTGKKESPPRHIRVGYVTDMRCPPPGADMAEAVQATARRCELAGHEVKPVPMPELCADAYAHHWTLIAAEAAKSHSKLFAKNAKEYPAKLRELIERGKAITADQVRQVQIHRDRVSAALDTLFEEHDVLLCPSADGPAPRGLEVTGDPRMSLLGTYAGIPALTLPAGLAPKGLPLGVQLLARRNQDARLLAAGLTIEALLNFDAKPAPPR